MELRVRGVVILSERLLGGKKLWSRKIRGL